VRQDDIRRIKYGHFVRPASETDTGFSRVEPTLGYAIRYSDGFILFDTGLAEADRETAEHYQPHRRTPVEALGEMGIELGDVRYVINSHLHFDHCGGNPFFPDRPIITQRIELENARTVDYTIRSAIDFDGARYDVVDTIMTYDVLDPPTSVQVETIPATTYGDDVRNYQTTVADPSGLIEKTVYHRGSRLRNPLSRSRLHA
jgi:glyoxylase-like metal-dependent hydrolase (beta-lactamase superfamily II)